MHYGKQFIKVANKIDKGDATMAWNDPKDLLERSKDARFLTDYLTGQYATNKESNFVLAVDAAWGRGKTYFLKNWKEDLEEQGYPVEGVRSFV